MLTNYMLKNSIDMLCCIHKKYKDAFVDFTGTMYYCACRQMDKGECCKRMLSLDCSCGTCNISLCYTAYYCKFAFSISH